MPGRTSSVTSSISSSDRAYDVDVPPTIGTCAPSHHTGPLVLFAARGRPASSRSSVPERHRHRRGRCRLLHPGGPSASRMRATRERPPTRERKTRRRPATNISTSRRRSILIAADVVRAVPRVEQEMTQRRRRLGAPSILLEPKKRTRTEVGARRCWLEIRSDQASLRRDAMTTPPPTKTSMAPMMSQARRSPPVFGRRPPLSPSPSPSPSPSSSPSSAQRDDRPSVQGERVARPGSRWP